jgi:hypothetical protein
MKNLNSRALACAAVLGLTAISGAARADALATPSMAGPLAANPNPFSVELPDWLGDAGGKIYITGAVSGLFYGQTDATHGAHGDADTFVDISNGQVFIQKTDGWLQFFVDVGAYSFPTVGVPYTNSSSTVSGTFGYVPVAYLKLVGTGDWSSFSIEGGKLPTLIGNEYGFTFQNMNIERGLLWNLEPIVSRGLQLNYASGPLTISFAVNDGYYTNVFQDLSGLISYGFNGGADTLAFTAEGDIAGPHVSPQGLAASVLNAGSVYDLIYTHTSGPWTISPYVQYITTPKIFAPKGENIWGGAVLVSYSIDDHRKLTARGEYESSSGNPATNFNLLGYGAGSKAWSITLTPSYQYKLLFARLDASYVGLGDATVGGVPFGGGFGATLTKSSQFRGVLEVGVLF